MFAPVLKKFVSLFLAVGILAQSLVQVGVVVYYHLNKTYISQKLCENRNNPKLHCEGHCYLTKQLKEAEEQEQKQSQNIIKAKEEIISNDNERVSVSFFPVFTSGMFIPYLSGYPISDYRNDLLKPPLT